MVSCFTRDASPLLQVTVYYDLQERSENWLNQNELKPLTGKLVKMSKRPISQKVISKVGFLDATPLSGSDPKVLWKLVVKFL